MENNNIRNKNKKGWNSFMEQYGTKIRNKKKKAGMERNGKQQNTEQEEKGWNRGENTEQSINRTLVCLEQFTEQFRDYGTEEKTRSSL